MEKSKKILLSALIVFMIALMIATLSLSIVTMLKVNAISDEQPIPEIFDEPTHDNEGFKSDVTTEDDVTISESYTIQSTKQISDAYLSGDSSDLSDDDKETLDAASAVLKEVIRDGMSDYEKEVAVFDWVHKNIRIDDDGRVLIQSDPDDLSTPHGVLNTKKAVCVGYATTFRLFMQMLDIPCKVVHDTDLVHSWNLVQIDGNWYHVDLYSADPYKEAYGYLNLPDALMHQEWDTDDFPAAYSFDACYVYKNAKEIGDYLEIPALVKEKLDKKESLLSVLCSNSSKDDSMSIEYMMERINSAITGSGEYPGCYLDYSVSEANDKLLVTMNILYEEDLRGGQNYRNVDQEKITGAVEDVFGKIPDDAYETYNSFYTTGIAQPLTVNGDEE